MRALEGSMGAIESSKEGLQNGLESCKILYEGSRRRYDALEGFQKALEGPRRLWQDCKGSVKL